MAALTPAIFLCVVTSWISAVGSGEQPEVTAKPGEDVPLQCRGPRGAAIRLIEWTRTDLKSKKYVFFFRDDQPVIFFQLPSYHGRVELRDPEMKNGDASVVLKNVNINDTGTYECWVSKGAAPKPTSTIRLTVTDPVLTAGHTREGGNKEGGNEDGHLGADLAVGGLVVVVVVVGFMIYKKRKVLTEKMSYKPPADTESDEEQLDVCVLLRRSK